MLESSNHESPAVSGLYATDKTPMYEIPLIYVMGFGVGRAFFCIGQWRFVLSLSPAQASSDYTLKQSAVAFRD